MMPRTVNGFSPSTVPSGERVCPTASWFLSANSFDRMSESGCARNTSGSSIDRLVAAARDRSRAGCGRRSCRRRAPAGCPAPRLFESTTASMTGTATRTVEAACTFSSTSSSKPVSPAVTCSSVLPAMRSTVCENANEHALIRGVHADEHGHAQHDPGRGQHVRSTCLRKYGQLIRRKQDHRRATALLRDVLDDAAVAERDGALAALGDLHVVRHDDDGRAEAACRSRMSAGSPRRCCVSRLPVGSSASRIGG